LRAGIDRSQARIAPCITYLRKPLLDALILVAQAKEGMGQKASGAAAVQ